MAKVTNNQTIKGRVFSTKNGQVLIGLLNANAGFQYVAVQAELLPNGDINQVTWVNASKLNIAQDVEPLVQALYSKVKMAIPSASSCPVLASFRAVLQEDLSLACYSDKLPIEVLSYKDKDTTGLTF